MSAAELAEEFSDEELASVITYDEVRTGTGKATKFSKEDVRLAITRIESTGIIQKLEAWRAEDSTRKGPGGRPPIVTDLTVLAILLLLVRERSPLWVTEMRNVLWFRLSPEARELLGLRPDSDTVSDRAQAKNWYNNAWNALHRFVDIMDPYPGPKHKLLNLAEREAIMTARDKNTMRRRKERLDWFSNQMLEMTFMMQPRRIRRRRRRIDVAFDQTAVNAVSRRGRAKRDPKTGREEKDTLILEMDADWYARNSAQRSPADPKGYVPKDWAFAGNITTRVAHDPNLKPDYPLIAMAFTLSKPNEDLGGETVRGLASIIDRGHEPGRAGGDKAYFANLKPESLHIPVRRLGWDVITDYKNTDLGIKGGKAGALQIEGEHYCPSMPEPLVSASIDAVNKDIDEPTYLARIKERNAYALRNKERPDERGHVPKMCPAYGPGATVECPLRDLHPRATKKQKPVILERNLPEAPDKICTQSSVDFAPEDGIRHAQYLDYGSEEWAKTYKHDRNTIESFNAQVKDPGYENLAASSRRRIRGFAAQQVLVTFLIVAANMRKIIKFLSDEERIRQIDGFKKPSRRRDREGHSNYKRQWLVTPSELRAESSTAPDTPTRV
jgi:hypothetical protein